MSGRKRALTEDEEKKGVETAIKAARDYLEACKTNGRLGRRPTFDFAIAFQVPECFVDGRYDDAAALPVLNRARAGNADAIGMVRWLVQYLAPKGFPPNLGALVVDIVNGDLHLEETHNRRTRQRNFHIGVAVQKVTKMKFGERNFQVASNQRTRSPAPNACSIVLEALRRNGDDGNIDLRSIEAAYYEVKSFYKTSFRGRKKVPVPLAAASIFKRPKKI